MLGAKATKFTGFMVDFTQSPQSLASKTQRSLRLLLTFASLRENLHYLAGQNDVMMRKCLLLIFCCSFWISINAQLQSPQDFLGYKIGEKYTPHWKIVNYFTHVANQAGSMVKLQPYGET